MRLKKGKNIMRYLINLFKKYVFLKFGFTLMKTETFHSLERKNKAAINSLDKINKAAIAKLEKDLALFKKWKLQSEMWPHIIPLFQTAPNLIDHPAWLIQKVDEDYEEKTLKLINKEKEFGYSKFNDITSYFFSSNLTNHHLIHQRIDEGSALWRATKNTKGNILEIGRAAGGSTALILASSGKRKVTSIDRDPFHSPYAQKIFERSDVKKRLTLKIQSSREKIENKKYNMMFIDGDHSYEGVCQDIAMYWNTLVKFNNCPPLAVFHDAVQNPIAFVPSVKKALDELINEKNVCRVVETWGSILVLEKKGNIDQKKWFSKTDKDFWKGKDDKNFKLSFTDSIMGKNSFNYNDHNILSDNYVKTHTPTLSSELESWRLDGMSINDPGLMSGGDNPVRFLIFNNDKEKKSIEKYIKVREKKLCFRIFFRPLNFYKINFKIRSKDNITLLKVNLDLNKNNKISNVISFEDNKVLGVECNFRNGFYDFSVNYSLANNFEDLIFTLEFNNKGVFENKSQGIYMNLSTLRQII